jgi:tRNA (adenine57-N1/adenine58-N1)-methyltransferase catalytic subunit
LGCNLHGTAVSDGDWVELVGLGHKHFIIQIKSGAEFQTHRGVLKHDDLIGKPWGSELFSHNGAPFFVLQPALADLLQGTPRISQILYPKEIGYILLAMGIGPGIKVVEAGTGSGSLTTAFANAVGDTGKVISYEKRTDMQNLARNNLTRLGLDHRVEFKLKDIQDGFDEKDADALFLDLPNPYDYIVQARNGLKPGGFFGAILPTTNQVIKLITELKRNDFAFLDVLEIMLRYYKPEPERFRPTDRMIAHTGFLIFARPILRAANQPDVDLHEFEKDI